MKSVVVSCFLFLSVGFLQASVHVVTNTQDTGSGSLREAVSNALAFDTVRFSPTLLSSGSDTIQLGSEIDISVPITIVGLYNTTDTLVLGGQNLTRIFNVFIPTNSLGNVWLDSLSFFRGRDTSDNGGGAVLIRQCDTLFADNCVFANNRSVSASGGAISLYRYVSPDEHTIIVHDSDFRNNVAEESGGAIDMYARNGTSWTSSFVRASFEAYQSRFMGNMSGDDGGAVSLRTPVSGNVSDSLVAECTIEQCEFIENNSSRGGAISLDLGYHDHGTSDIHLLESTFEKNVAEYGGGLYQTFSQSNQDTGFCTLLVEDCEFRLNGFDTVSSGGDGGAICLYNMDTEASISETVFDSNLAGNDGGALAFAESWGVDVWLDLTVSDSAIFIDNTALGSGGGIFIDTDSALVSLEDGRFQDNTASGSGGGLNCWFGDIEVDGCAFIGNEAGTDGAIGVYGPVDISHSQFVGNVANSGDAGAVRGYEMSVNASIIRNNTCVGKGGGLLYTGTMEVGAQSIIEGNSAGDEGGGIFGWVAGSSNDPASVCILIVEDSSRIDSNSAGAAGGGVYLSATGTNNQDSAIAILDHAFITGNTSADYGGGLCVVTSDVSICEVTHSMIQGNDAVEDGGGIYQGNHFFSVSIDLGFTDINNSVFADNSSDEYGGGFASQNALVNASIFSGNSAGKNGGAFYADFDTTYIYSSQFLNNTGGWDGGAVDSRVVYMNSSLFDGNSATLDGGGISAQDLYSQNNTFINNTADSDGGGIYCSNHLVFNDGTIDSNYAAMDGGGAYAHRLDIGQSQIRGNASDQDGGGLFMKVAQLQYEQSIIDCEVSDNSSNRNGGGIYAWAQSYTVGALHLEVENSTVAYNTADSNGGGIYARGYFAQDNSNNDTTRAESRVFLNHSTVHHNTAIRKGGGVYSYGQAGNGATYGNTVLRSRVSINTSTISHNHAEFGGAIASETNRLYYSSGGTSRSSLSFVNVVNSTVYHNTGDTIGGIFNNGWQSTVGPVYTRSSIIADNDSLDILVPGLLTSQFDIITSDGYNVFGTVLAGFASTDQVSISAANLNLGSLANNGGDTETHLPQSGSVTLNNGNPNDNSDAQNGAINYNRDVGAAESNLCDVYNIQQASACGSFYWSVTDSNYFASGTYIDSSFDSGCAEVYTLNLTLADTHAQWDTVSACDTYTWPVNGHTLQQSGDYSDTLVNAFGCDSVIHLNLTINTSFSAQQNEQACFEYQWPVDGNTYTQSGTYTYMDTTANGCDSIHTLVLTVNTIDTTVVENYPKLQAIMAGAQYQWLRCDSGYTPIAGENGQNYEPDTTGWYAVAITRFGCTDTSTCRFFDKPVGIAARAGQEGITIYPNPSHGEVVIEGLKSQSEVRIYDAQGALVRHYSEVNTDRMELQLPIQQGVYHVVISGEDGVHTQRLIKM